MTRLILLIGLPGSGKSTLAGQLIAFWPSYQLVSTDAIRAQLFGDEGIQGEWLLLWRQVQRQFQTAAAQKATTIYDATNAQRPQAGTPAPPQAGTPAPQGDRPSPGNWLYPHHWHLVAYSLANMSGTEPQPPAPSARSSDIENAPAIIRGSTGSKRRHGFPDLLWKTAR